MSWAEEQILEGMIKKKLVLSSFYGQEKAGNIKAIIKDTGGSGREVVSDLPYGTTENSIVSSPIQPLTITSCGNDIFIFNGYEGYRWHLNKWTRIHVLPFSSGSSTPFIGYNGFIHAFSGSSHYAYNIEENTWELIDSDVPSGAYGRFYPYLYLNKFYITPVGTSGWGAMDAKGFLYDPENNTWTSIGAAPLGYDGKAGSQTSIGFDYKYIYMWRGVYNQNYPNAGAKRFSAYDPDSNTWSQYVEDVSSNWYIVPLVSTKYLKPYEFLALYSNSIYKLTTSASFNSLTWTAVGKSPILNVSGGSHYQTKWIITDDNIMHIVSSATKEHCILNFDDLFNSDKMWYKDPEYVLPYDFYDGSAVVFNNIIHLLGDNNNVSPKRSNYISKFDGSNWSYSFEITYDFYEGSAVVYDGKIHLLGGEASQTKHAEWYDNDTIVELSALPYNFYKGSAVVYNDEIHILGGYARGTEKYHYKYNGTTWVSASTLPINFTSGIVVIYNDEIHILVGTSHYKYNGTSWVQVSSIPITVTDGSAVVYGDEIHVFIGLSHYKFSSDTSLWSNVSTIPYNFNRGSAVVYGDSIYLFGTADANYAYKNIVYRFNGTSWLPGNPGGGLINNSTVIYNNSIHILGGNDGENDNKHYSYDDASKEWVSVSTLPYSFIKGSSEVYENQIHLLGGLDHGYLHYSYDGNEWSSKTDLPYDFYDGCSMVLNNELHILGSAVYEFSKKHYKFDGTSWIEEPDLPYPLISGLAFSINNSIHILGGSGGLKNHYVLTDGEWIQYPDLEEGVIEASGVLFNNEIHIFNNVHHSKLIGNQTYITDKSELPFYFKDGSAIVKDGCINLLGGGSEKYYKFHESGIKPVKLEDVEIYFY